jgi:alkylation response protein AidB-like acyl-CoA dehydrogenase
MTDSLDILAVVRSFITDLVYPAEPTLAAGGAAAATCLATLQQRARESGLWALPLPVALGGGGLDLASYAPIAEVEGSSDYGPTVLGSDLLLDATMLERHGSPVVKDRFLRPMVAGQIRPSFGMTEPGVSGSDPRGLRTVAELEGDSWVIRGRKWFTSGAAQAAFTTVVCRTEGEGVPAREAFSLLVVPTDARGYRVVRDLPVLGAHGGHGEIELAQVRVPAGYLLGARGAGLAVAAQRLALGRTLRCLRWLGQTARAYHLLCERLVHRHVSGGPLGGKQLMQQHAFDSHVDLAAARALTRAALECLIDGVDPAVAVGTAKVVTARAFAAVVDRAIQVHGAEGLTDDTPLARLHRTARSARILDGPDEVHVQAVARRLLRAHQQRRQAAKR